jgi:hypothetical protein
MPFKTPYRFGAVFLSDFAEKRIGRSRRAAGTAFLMEDCRFFDRRTLGVTAADDRWVVTQ